MTRAACRSLAPLTADALFFGRDRGTTGGQIFTETDLARARALCEGCPVLWECLVDALAAPRALDRHGVRAGLLPDERRTLHTTTTLTREQAALYLGGDEPHARRGQRRPRA